MKEQNASSEKKKPRLSGEKKFYLFTALGCAAVLLAIIIVAIAVSNNKKVNNVDGGQDSNTLLVPDEPSQDVGNPDGDDEPVIVTPEGMLSPIESVAVSNDYGFFHNQTVNFYYEHEGVDFVATAGTEVKAVQDGVVESIYKDDILLGTEIVVNHGDGLKSVYRFVDEAEGLKVGDSVARGEVIATVAEANGNEYKDGAHLHFEIRENGVNVDPTKYLTLEEK